MNTSAETVLNADLALRSTDALWMGEAFVEAQQAFSRGEVPVGAVLVVNNEIIARAHNLVETKQDPTAHAEILAVRSAAKSLKNWRLEDASLYVTLEPCPMCIGALLLSRVKHLYFACPDPRLGAVGSIFDLSNLADLPHSIEVRSGLFEAESRELLKKFFQTRRGGRVVEGA